MARSLDEWRKTIVGVARRCYQWTTSNTAEHARDKAVCVESGPRPEAGLVHRTPPGTYAYTAEGDPNTGIVIGDDSMLVIDTQATPIMAQDIIRWIRDVTDKPIEHIVLSHGYTCIAEVRMIEPIRTGATVTFLRYGDSIRLEMRDARGRSIFRSIARRVVGLPRQMPS